MAETLSKMQAKRQAIYENLRHETSLFRSENRWPEAFHAFQHLSWKKDQTLKRDQQDISQKQEKVRHQIHKLSQEKRLYEHKIQILRKHALQKREKVAQRTLDDWRAPSSPNFSHKD
jgi:hypothetical protein